MQSTTTRPSKEIRSETCRRTGWPTADCIVEQSQRQRFLDFVKRYRNLRIIITTHIDADADGSCVAAVLLKLFPNAVIAFQNKPSIEAIAIIRRLGIRVHLLKEIKGKYDGIAVVDNSSPGRVPYLRSEHKRTEPIVLIVDHHYKGDHGLTAETEIVCHTAPSTCEVLYRILPDAILSDKNVALALVVGHLSDMAAVYKYSSEHPDWIKKLIAVSETPIDEIRSYVYPRFNRTIQNAIDIAVANARQVMYNGFDIRVNTTPLLRSRNRNVLVRSIVATDLINKGADISLIITKVSQKKCRCSIRVEGSITGISAGDIANALGTQLNGEGNGHLHMAGATTIASETETIAVGVKIIKEMIDKIRRGTTY